MASRSNTGMKAVSVALRILTTILLIVVIIWLATLTYHTFYSIFADIPYSKTSGNEVTATIRVTKEDSAGDVGEMLENAGIVESGRIFKYQMMLEEKKNDIQPGTYKLSSTMTPLEIMEVITTVVETDEEEESSSSGGVTAGSAGLLDSSLSQ